jgi:hypothetical protein
VAPRWIAVSEKISLYRGYFRHESLLNQVTQPIVHVLG